MVVLLGKMRQHNVRCIPIIIVSEEIREGVIGKMTNPAHDPLFHRPGIWPSPEHLNIMI